MTYLFTFAGRMSRRAFWTFGYGIMALTMFPLAVCAVLSIFGFPNWIWWAVLAGFIAHQIAGLSGVVRRLHDRNLSGWWTVFSPLAALTLFASGMLLMGVLVEPYSSWAFFGGPLAGMIVLFWTNTELYFRSGTPGPNRFGPPSE